MSKLVKLLSTIYLTHTYLTATCTFLQREDPRFRQLYDADVASINERIEKSATENYCPPIDKRFLNICKKSKREFVENVPKKAFLGQGALGTVMSAVVGPERVAVKRFAIDSALSDELERSTDIDAVILKVIAVEVILNTITANWKEPPSEITGEDLLARMLSKEEIAKHLKYREYEVDVETFASLIFEKLEDIWKLIINEIDLNELIIETLSGFPGNTAKYKECFVDYQLNTNIVMEPLGLSLVEARDACDAPLRGAGYEDQIPRYTRMFFTVVMLQNAGINLCNIKLDNLLLSEDFDARRFLFGGLGVATITRACQHGTLEYKPPEAFRTGYQETSFEETTTDGLRLVNQYDSYSLGITLFGLELNLESFRVLLRVERVLIQKAFREKEDKIKEAEQEFDQKSAESMPENYGLARRLTEIDEEFDQAIEQVARNIHELVNIYLTSSLDEIVDENANKATVGQNAKKTTVNEKKTTVGQNVKMTMTNKGMKIVTIDEPTFYSSVNTNPTQEPYSRAVQKLINMVIGGLLDPDPNARLSPRQALYLFVLLGRLTDPKNGKLKRKFSRNTRRAFPC